MLPARSSGGHAPLAQSAEQWILNPATKPEGADVTMGCAEGRPDPRQFPSTDLREAQADSRLALLLDAWPSLPEPTRRGILALIAATLEGAGEDQ